MYRTVVLSSLGYQIGQSLLITDTGNGLVTIEGERGLVPYYLVEETAFPRRASECSFSLSC